MTGDRNLFAIEFRSLGILRATGRDEGGKECNAALIGFLQIQFDLFISSPFLYHAPPIPAHPSISLLSCKFNISFPCSTTAAPRALAHLTHSQQWTVAWWIPLCLNDEMRIDDD